MEIADTKKIAVLIIVTCVMIILYGRIDYTEQPYSGLDLSYYRQMAGASPRIETDIPKPYAYRLLGPYIAGLLPIADPAAFYVLSILVALACVILLYLFLCDMGVGASAAVIAALCFCFNKHMFGFNVWDYFQLNDLLSMVFLVIMFVAMIKGRWLLFGVTMLAGVLTREITLLMIPVTFIYLVEKKKLSREWSGLLAAAVPAVAVFILLRIMIPTSGKGIVEVFMQHSKKLGSAESWFRLWINAFIPLVFLPLVFLGRTIEFFRTRIYALVLVLLVFLSTLFGMDNERLMAPAFIVFYWLIACIIDKDIISSRRLIWFVVAFACLASVHHEITVFRFIPRYATVAISIGATVVVTVGAIMLRLWRKRLAA